MKFSTLENEIYNIYYIPDIGTYILFIISLHTLCPSRIADKSYYYFFPRVIRSFELLLNLKKSRREGEMSRANIR